MLYVCWVCQLSDIHGVYTAHAPLTAMLHSPIYCSKFKCRYCANLISVGHLFMSSKSCQDSGHALLFCLCSWELYNFVPSLKSWTPKETRIHTTSIPIFLICMQYAYQGPGFRNCASCVLSSEMAAMPSGDPRKLDSQDLLEKQNDSAKRIQIFFKRKRDTTLKRSQFLEKFCHNFAEFVRNVDWKLHGEEHNFIDQLLLLFDAKVDEDVDVICQVCDMILQYVEHDGDLLSLFAGVDYSEMEPVLIIRVRKFALICVYALQKRFDLFSQPETSSNNDPMPLLQLLKTCLLNKELPWNCIVVSYLQKKMVFCVFREIIMAVLQSERQLEHCDCFQALYHVIILVAAHVGNGSCGCLRLDKKWSFCSQILTIPFLCYRLPRFKKVLSADGFSSGYMYQIADADVHPNDTLANHSGQAHLLANVLANVTLSLSADFNVDREAGIVDVCTSLLAAFPQTASPIESTYVDGVMPIDVDLQRYILKLVEYLVNDVVRIISSTDYSDAAGSSSSRTYIESISAFLHCMLSTGFFEGIMTVLLYNTQIVLALWNHVKSSFKNEKLKSSPECPMDTPSWLLSLSIFCLMYSHTLELMDIDEFKKCEKPLSLEDLKSLISILKETLWELMWPIPVQTSSVQTSQTLCSRMSIESLKHSARTGICELLLELEDWNNRVHFVNASEFCSKEDFGAEFVFKATTSGTRESDILRLAPFLVPFAIRLKIFHQHLVTDQSYIQELRQFPAPHTIEISRNRLWDDAFDSLSLFSVEDLKGKIQVIFIDEHGTREAGVDGGGIFRDFMNTVTKAAFRASSRFFMETEDHLLYPNPESRLADESHLQYFYFLGILLGKAIYESIPVDLSFAISFLRMLKQKPTSFNDLSSMDPTFYKSLWNMKSHMEDLSELQLEFDDLLPGGGEISVTADNLITYMHLAANHKLNLTRIQTAEFLRGFQQLIPKEWIDMFNEHEFQLLISGPPCLDLKDLCLNTIYGGDYHEGHDVILMFWNILSSFSPEEQQQFLLFVTGCPRGPAKGFETLDPKFRITSYVVPGTDYTSHLPSAQTCYNQLSLPPYPTEEEMRDKLSLAISAGAGFDLE